MLLLIQGKVCTLEVPILLTSDFIVYDVGKLTYKEFFVLLNIHLKSFHTYLQLFSIFLDYFVYQDKITTQKQTRTELKPVRLGEKATQLAAIFCC